MRIAKINSVISNYEFTKKLNPQNVDNKSNNLNYTSSVVNSYKDFNVNFQGRTPENFYAQEYNVKYMPNEMKKYLAVDYETRKHIPPEQVMGEVFKYITLADNVEDVKKLYPEEDLFQNLHEASLKGRSGILSDIKLAREIEKAPLFNDKSDDLGVYLLKKIYMEGKTIREINKDFYEKDLNEAYKGIITQPINYGTTSAYGIRYPKQDFWNSFIATRDEYRKFFIANLPKTSKEVNGVRNGHSSSSRFVADRKKDDTRTPPKRKYTLKSYRKKDLKDDIKAGKADKNAIEKAVRKRFTKDDPEASFIVKYLSPIMTVAADRIHLSEEEKAFAEADKPKNTNGEFMFSRFWKANPELLEQYSTAITDTIELFEEAYGAGGNIGINNEYEKISSKIENTKPIDFVSEEFLRLLNYTQTIVPKRMEKYQEHDRLQAEWEKHFIERYGEVQNDDQEIKKDSISQEQIEEKLNSVVNDYDGANIYNLKGKNGDNYKIVGKLDEALSEYVTKMSAGLPTRYKDLIYRYTLKHPLCDDSLKLSIAVNEYRDKLEEGQILPFNSMLEILNTIKDDFNKKYEKEAFVANFATGETLAKRYMQPFEVFVGMFFNRTASFAEKVEKIICDDKDTKTMDGLYEKYSKPLQSSEVNKISINLAEWINHFDSKKLNEMNAIVGSQSTMNLIMKIVHDEISENKFNRKLLKSILMRCIEKQNIARSVLDDKNETLEYKEAKLYTVTNIILRDLLTNINSYSQHLKNDEFQLLLNILSKVKKMDPHGAF